MNEIKNGGKRGDSSLSHPFMGEGFCLLGRNALQYFFWVNLF